MYEDTGTGAERTRSQSAAAILMIRPAAFGFDRATAATNSFQAEPTERVEFIHQQAVTEFDSVVQGMRRADVETIVVDDALQPPTPDAVFPNNWISTHHDGTVVLYPMCAPNRRLERRRDVIDLLSQECGFDVRRVIDLSPDESSGRYLEGTGSVVFDHPNRVAYACLSPRTDRGVLYEIGEVLGYECVVFRATDLSGEDIYHTNVVMSIGTSFAIVCSEAIRDEQQIDAVLNQLELTGRDVITLTRAQMVSFAGNLLEVRTREGHLALAVSACAWDAFTAEQRLLLGALAQVVTVPIPTIESVGGGSIRCMIAEIFLPRPAQ